MAKPHRLALVLLLSALLSISLSQGFGRNVVLIKRNHRLHPNKPLRNEENVKIRREMRGIEINDYGDPRANVNPRNGPLLNPPISPTPPNH